MSAARRIVVEVSPAIISPRATTRATACGRAITLDGKRYCCGVEIYGIDRTHSGVHDAFVRHSDGGLVRW